MTRKKLEILSKANFGEVSNENRTPIESICINDADDSTARILPFLEQAENPYFLQIGKITIKFEFADGGPSFEELLVQYFKQNSSQGGDC